ncbi:DoxX family membrane protein [Kitasatospora sp. NPDC087315]|uniref:DoxX family membrane protein n=1 Tax=Kitasatospora sp. NPDC087315 TaxID=3364069 RepID=UPI00380D23BE
MKLTAERLRASARCSAPASVHAPPVSAADVGLLVLRLAGLLLAGHGAQKLFGLFGGAGLSATGKGFEALGYRPGTLFAALGGASELCGGLGLALGLLTPLAAATVVGVMINAMSVSSSGGLWADKGGLEYPLCLSLIAIAVSALGPGRLALDRPFRWGRGGWWSMAVALGMGGIGAAIVLSLKGVTL